MSNDPFRRRVAALLAGTVLVLAPAACSLPVDERVTPLDQAAFPDDLTEPTTTTTTTTTTSVPVTPPPSVSTPDGDAATTTAPVLPTETVTVYYTRGVSDVMQPVQVVAPLSPAIVTDLITFLERPSGISESGLRSAVRLGLIDDIVVERGTATVSLDADVLDRMSESTRQQAIAQIVLTVTSFRTADVGAIGRVLFEVDGEGFPVFVPAFGGTSEAGEELSFTDFQSLIATTPTPDTTATTTTTTEPVETPPADADAG